MAGGATLDLWTHPGSERELLRWDPWRRRWEVWCAAPAREGAASRRVAELCAAWLALPLSEVSLVGGRSRAKRLVVRSLTPEEAERRLRAAAAAFAASDP